MYVLYRVYRNDRVVFAVTLDRTESLVGYLGLKPHPTNCRCRYTPDPFEYLAAKYGLGAKKVGLWRYEHGYIDSTPIYPSPRKDT